MSTQRARQLRKNMTDAERALWAKLRRRQMFGLKFRRQHKRPYKKGPLTRWLEDQGFEVMRFWNHQVLTETEAVVQAVANALDAPPATPYGVATSPASGEENKMPE